MKRLVKFFTAAALLFLSLPAGALAATPAPSPTPASANSNGDLHSIIYGTQFYDPNDCTGSSGTPTSTGIDHNLPGKNPERTVDRREVGCEISAGMPADRPVDQFADKFSPRNTLRRRDPVQRSGLALSKVDVRALHTPHHTPSVRLGR